MTALLQRTRRCGAPSGETDSAGCPKHCGSKAKPHCCRIKRTGLQRRTISARSLDLARRQGALSWELRTATSLGRLRRDENRIGGAYDLVSSVYDRFSEGFGT